jgi:3-oxoacid CoA-transferase A subunit
MNKECSTVDEAIADVFDGASIAIGGFFSAGLPLALVRGLIAKGVQNLTIIGGSGPLLGSGDELDLLVATGQIRKLIDSYPFYRSASRGAESLFEQAARSGEIEVEVYPMGTLAEKLRAAAAGIPAFYTPTGVGTVAGSGRETRFFNGVENIMETALQPDFAFVHAYMGDREGNLVYRMTAMNFNPVMAAAAKVTIAEVENLVEPHEIRPEMVRTPGIYVRRVVQVGRMKRNVTPT